MQPHQSHTEGLFPSCFRISLKVNLYCFDFLLCNVLVFSQHHLYLALCCKPFYIFSCWIIYSQSCLLSGSRQLQLFTPDTITCFPSWILFQMFPSLLNVCGLLLLWAPDSVNHHSVPPAASLTCRLFPFKKDSLDDTREDINISISRLCSQKRCWCPACFWDVLQIDFLDPPWILPFEMTNTMHWSLYHPCYLRGDICKHLQISSI